MRSMEQYDARLWRAASQSVTFACRTLQLLCLTDLHSEKVRVKGDLIVTGTAFRTVAKRYGLMRCNVTWFAKALRVCENRSKWHTIRLRFSRPPMRTSKVEIDRVKHKWGMCTFKAMFPSFPPAGAGSSDIRSG